MKLYYITGHDHMDECGGVCINQVHRMFKTREAAESCLALHIKDVRDYLWYLHKEDGVSYTDEVRTKNSCIDFFIAEAIYDLSDPKQYDAFLESPAMCEAGMCDTDTKVSVSIDHEAETHIYRREDDNTKTQTFACLSIYEIETDNLT